MANFVIAIGGTGMRCLESFVHLCAVGLFDNNEINILTLDTDQTNGNKGRVESLVNKYNKVKTNDQQTIGGQPCSDSFFSAKLNLYKFFADYSTSERQTLNSLSKISSSGEDNQDLADLFFERESVQSFDLSHGYRAQTHLGSMLMYHAIIEAALRYKASPNEAKEHERDLCDFLDKLGENSNNAKVFVFGSVFGGTGASSIPVLPVAISEALKILKGGKTQLDLNQVKFGSTLLTNYFTFNSPSDEQLQKDKVIADANNFALNSQAAMGFYNDDPTVKTTYKVLYHIGWPADVRINYSESSGGRVLTGGTEQENPCHIAELMCASAAYDFFNVQKLDNKEANYVFRTVEETDGSGLNFTGASFVGGDIAESFENKIGALLSLSHIILGTYEGSYAEVNGVELLLSDLSKERDIFDYDTLNQVQAKEINDYLQEYAYKIVEGKFKPGWIYQVFQSVGKGMFLFKSNAFESNIGSLNRVDYANIFTDPNHNWSLKRKMGGITTEDKYDAFVRVLRQNETLPEEKQGSSIKEKFLAHLYNTMTILQNY